jgi:hypothetical protein
MINKDKIIKEAIGEDFESIRYHDDCYITVRECKQIMDKLESELKNLRVTDVSGSVCDFIGCKNKATNEVIVRNEYYCDKHS